MDFSSGGYVSTSSKFEEFLSRGGSFRSLILGDRDNGNTVDERSTEALSIGPKKRVLLLEEIPNIHSSASPALQSFRSAISIHLATGQPQKGHLGLAAVSSAQTVPLIVVISETQLAGSATLHDNFNIHRLLGADILSHPHTDVVEFNPIAPTFLAKALDLVIKKEARHSGRRRVPGRLVLSRLSDVGDVRSAIGALEFLCVKREDDEGWSGRVAATGKKGAKSTSKLTSSEIESLEMVTQRESSLGLFHAVGRVVYNKREEAVEPGQLADIPPQPPDYLPQHVRSKALEISVDGLIDETGSDVQTFVAALHENYVLSCEGNDFTDTLGACIDYLSDSDVLVSGGGGRFQPKGKGGSLLWRQATEALRQDEISFHVAVRGLLFSLPQPVKRSAHPTGMVGRKGGRGDAHKMFYPASMRLFGQIQTTEELINRWSERAQAGATHPRRHDRQSPEVASWGRNVWSKEQSSIPDNGLECEMSRRMLLPSNDSMIQEVLPYQTLIERARPTSALLRELNDITKLSMDTPAAVQDTFDKERGTATFHANPGGENEPGRAGLAFGQAIGETPLSRVLEQDVEHLYLSDDDIEDDFG